MPFRARRNGPPLRLKIYMRLLMNDNAGETSELLRLVRKGNEEALGALLSQYRERLKRMIRLRLNSRLQGRIDASDVIQEAYLEALRRIDDYLKEPNMPFFLWLRQITGQKLMDFHRRHLGAQIRDARREVSLYRGALPAPNSVSLAAQLLGHLTSPSQAAVKAEMRIRVQETLNSMHLIDREVLALRHFEQLSNVETAQVLGLSESGATARYLRALKRLKDLLSQIPGFFDQ